MKNEFQNEYMSEPAPGNYTAHILWNWFHYKTEKYDRQLPYGMPAPGDLTSTVFSHPEAHKASADFAKDCREIVYRTAVKHSVPMDVLETVRVDRMKYTAQREIEEYEHMLAKDENHFTFIEKEVEFREKERAYEAQQRLKEAERRGPLFQRGPVANETTPTNKHKGDNQQ